MKKLNILFISVLALAMTVVSCSKDDKDESVKELKVPLGKFVFTKWTETKDGVTSEERSAYRPGCTEKRYYNFKAEGEVEEFAGYNPNEPCAFILYDGTYTQTGNVVTITGAYPQTYTILDVTATQLKISWAFPTEPTHVLTYTLIKE